MSFNPLALFGIGGAPTRKPPPEGTVASIAGATSTARVSPGPEVRTARTRTTGGSAATSPTTGITVRKFPGGPLVFRPNAERTGRKAVPRGQVGQEATGASADFEAAELAAFRQRRKAQTGGRQGTILAGFTAGAPTTKRATLIGG